MAEANQIKEHRKRTIPPWFIILVLLLLGFALFGERGVLKVYKTYQQKTDLEQKIADLEKVNDELRQEIDALREDLKTIENIARRELGMVKPDEQVYQFHNNQQQSPPQMPTDQKLDDGEEHPENSRVDTTSGGG
ncbi:MAG: hypothetical protein C0623_06060 [Desulfuromonas sp.]|nr:MAG: hypothetical protein C0623_06060 [Desulfuromonas sp.]